MWHFTHCLKGLDDGLNLYSRPTAREVHKRMIGKAKLDFDVEQLFVVRLIWTDGYLVSGRVQLTRLD